MYFKAVVNMLQIVPFAKKCGEIPIEKVVQRNVSMQGCYDMNRVYKCKFFVFVVLTIHFLKCYSSTQ